jgi:hypothetical protein
VSEAYIETSSNTTTTQITTPLGGSTYFQPVVGSQTGSAVTPAQSGGASASGGGSSSGGGASGANGGTANAAQTSKGAAGRGVEVVGWGGVFLGGLAAWAAL